MRNILIYTTIGENEKTIQSQSTKWGALQRDLEGYGVQHDGMKAIVGETRNTLESSEAQLPEGDFTLYLMQKKSKAGLTDDQIDAMEYKVCRTTIKGIIADAGKDKDEITRRKLAFSDGSKNYTQTKVPVMKMNLKKWFRSLLDTTTKPVEEVEKVEEVVEVAEKNVADIVDSVKDDKETESESIDALSIFKDLNIHSEDLNVDENNTFEAIKTAIIQLNDVYWARVQAEKEEAERLAKEQAEKEKEEAEKKAKAKAISDKLKATAKAMSREFNDLESL